MKYTRNVSDVILAALIALVCAGVGWALFQIWLWLETWNVTVYRMIVILGLPLSNLATFIITRAFFDAQVQQRHKGLEIGVGAVSKQAADTVNLRGEMHRRVREVWRPDDRQTTLLPPMPPPTLLAGGDDYDEIEM